MIQSIMALQALSSLIDLLHALTVGQIKAGAEGEDYLQPHHESDQELADTVLKVQALMPEDVGRDTSPDAVRIAFQDIYDNLPCSLRSRIVTIGILTFARGIAEEIEGRKSEQLKQELFGSLQGAGFLTASLEDLFGGEPPPELDE